jgi:hypothetical protein
MNTRRIEYLMVSEASLIRTSFMEGFREGWNLSVLLITGPFRLLWAFVRGKPEVSYTLRTR